MYNNYCPYKYKYELVNWAIKYRGFSKSKANAMSKAQLYAIFYNYNQLRL